MIEEKKYTIKEGRRVTREQFKHAWKYTVRYFKGIMDSDDAMYFIMDKLELKDETRRCD